MASNDSNEILHKFFFFKVHKDGQIHFNSPPTQIIPPMDDPTTGVRIKDVTISDDVSVRVFCPSGLSSSEKIPVLVYIHGGGYCIQSAFSVEYTRLMARIVGEGKILGVSIEYGLFPHRPIPACYEDSWAALSWVASHHEGGGPDPWLNQHGDFNRLFVGGDSAGGNISHQLAVRAGTQRIPFDVKLKGILLIHPHFLEDDELWMYMCPTNEGPKDRRIKPPVEDLIQVESDRVLVMVAQYDHLREGGKKYAMDLEKSGWKGKVEFVYNEGKCHCFHVNNPDDEDAADINRRMIEFIYRDE